MLPDLFGNIVILPNHHFMTTAYNSTQKRLSFYDSEGKFNKKQKVNTRNMERY